MYPNTPSVIKPLVIGIVSVLSLVACGGGDSDSSASSTLTNPSTTQPVPADKPLGDLALVQAGSDQAFAQYYQAGLNNSLAQYSTMRPEAAVDSVDADMDVGDSADKTSNDFGVSSTNLVDAGVDEADVAKQNDTHIYTVSYDYKDNGSYLNAFSKPDGKQLSSTKISNEGNTGDIYLVNDKLSLVRQANHANWYMSDVLATQNGKIAIDMLDISNPANPSTTNTYTWEGSLKTSRRIGNNLYVVSSSSINNPWNCGGYPILENQTDVSVADDSASNKMIPVEPYPNCEYTPPTPSEIAERMPVDITGAKIKPADCFIPNDYSEDSTNINSNITLVTKIDLSGGSQHTTTCIAASADHVYMTPKSLYLAGYDYTDVVYPATLAVESSISTKLAPEPKNRTLINKFKLQNSEAKYVGTGAVTGEINWSTASFSMNEYQDVLRVVTSSWRADGILNQLHTLRESTNKTALDLIATIPNAQQPKSIGKPKEQIQGIRFFGDEGYVVTFERKDPLYKIDLSNPANPTIKGELEMPGYSAYLQRIQDNLLMGVGYMAADDGTINGVQTTVFDTSGDNPTIVSQKTVPVQGNPEFNIVRLPIAMDSRAIMTLKNANTMRVAIPYLISTFTPNGRYGSEQHQINTLEYEINLTTGIITEAQQRDVSASLDNTSDQQLSAYYRVAQYRALLDGDDIYYSLGDDNIIPYKWN